MARIGNPFRAPLHNYPQGYYAGGYNNPQMAETANNISGFLMGGETPIQQKAREQKAALDAAHATYYGAETSRANAQTGKLNAETEAMQRGARMQSDNEIFNTALYEHGIDPRMPNDQVQAALDADPSLKSRVLARVGAYRGQQTLTGQTNAQQFEAGQSAVRDRNISDMVIGGQLDPTRVAQAEYAAKGGAPFAGGKEQSTNVLTGAQTINPIGNSEIDLNKNRGTEAIARANQANAAANEHNAKASVGKLVTEFTGNYDENGTPIVQQRTFKPGETVRTLPAAGYAPKNPAERATDIVKMNDAIGAETMRQLGQNLDRNGQWAGSRSDFKADQDVTGAVIQEARAIQDQTGENRPDVLVRSAITNLKQRGLQQYAPTFGQNVWRMGQPAPTPSVGGMVTGQSQPAPGQQSVPQSLPQAAASRLREGVVTTFGNGQQWTLKGGQPVQVQ